MSVEFRNPTFLHERWGNLADAQLVGLFQYEQHATLLAKALAAAEPDGADPKSRRAWVVTESYSGKQFAWTREYLDREAAKP